MLEKGFQHNLNSALFLAHCIIKNSCQKNEVDYNKTFFIEENSEEVGVILNTENRNQISLIPFLSSLTVWALPSKVMLHAVS